MTWKFKDIALASHFRDPRASFFLSYIAILPLVSLTLEMSLLDEVLRAFHPKMLPGFNNRAGKSIMQ